MKKLVVFLAILALVTGSVFAQGVDEATAETYQIGRAHV